MIDREDIIRMAREAGMDALNGIRDDNSVSVYYEAWPEQLERFAALVASAAKADERERIITANAPEIEKVNAALNRLTEENTKLWGWYHDAEQHIAILQRRARGETK